MSTTMELIVRTAHGQADVQAVVHDPAATLRDLIGSVTNQAVPAATLVDGRIVDTAMPLAQSNIYAGSIIDTDVDPTSNDDLATRSNDRASGDAVVMLMQLTGSGAGVIRSLSPGRYRIGSGHRSNANELDFTTVRDPAFELEVDDVGRVVIFPVEPPTSQRPEATTRVELDGRPISSETEWSAGTIVTNGRVFALVHGIPNRPRELRAPDAAGRVVMNRPPGRVDEKAILVTRAVLDATFSRPALWKRGTVDPGPMSIPVGIVPSTMQTATVDLVRDRVVGIVGSDDQRSGHARAILIEALTRFGPSHVELAIATNQAQLGDWDWCKWLPHARHGQTTQLFTRIDSVDAWIRSSRSVDRRSLLVVDDHRWWTDPQSPLRAAIIDGSPDIAVLALTDDRRLAPESCGAVIEHSVDDISGGPRSTLSRMSHDHLDDDGRSTGNVRQEILAPFTETRVALEVARTMAPLVDPDSPILDEPTENSWGSTLLELLGIEDAGSLDTRWNRALGSPGNPVSLPIGTLDGESFGVDLGIDRSVVISGSALSEASNVAQTLLLAMASTWSPIEMSIVTIDHRPSTIDSVQLTLPHHAGVFDRRGAAAARRLVEQLHEQTTTGESSGRRIVVVVDDAESSELAAPGILRALSDLAHKVSGIHLVVVTDVPVLEIGEKVRAANTLDITVDRVGGRRRATMHDRRTGIRTPFTPFERAQTTTGALTLRPFMFGRAPTTLERRLERSAGADDQHESADRELDTLVATLHIEADRLGQSSPALVPRALPDAIDASELRRMHPGDAVPLGLVETGGEPEPFWWRPGTHGTLLLVGAPRTGGAEVIETLMAGVVARFAADELRLALVDSTGRRQRSIASVPHTEAVMRHDEHDATAAYIDELHAGLNTEGTYSTARLLVIVELDRLIEALRDKHPAAITQLGDLVHRGGDAGVNVVATASSGLGLDTLLDAFANRAIGNVTDASQYAPLGVADPGFVSRRQARFVLVPSQQRVQMAISTMSFDEQVRQELDGAETIR